MPQGACVLIAVRSMHPGHNIKDFAAFHERLIKNIGNMRRIPPSCLDLLLSPEDLRVTGALQEWLAHDSAPVQGSTADAHMSAFQSKR